MNNKIKDAVIEGKLHRHCYNLYAKQIGWIEIMESTRNPEGNNFTEPCDLCLEILKENYEQRDTQTHCTRQ